MFLDNSGIRVSIYTLTRIFIAGVDHSYFLKGENTYAK